MNFGDCLRVLEVGIGRDDLREFYPAWIHQALRSIQADYDWNCMRHDESVTMRSGSSSTSLPSDFKALQSARPPVFMRGQGDTGAVWMPCDVVREEELLRRRATFLSSSVLGAGPDVWLSVDSDRWYLNIVDTLVGDAVFKVKYFRFLPDLTKNEDENDLTRNYEEMVKHKIKAVGFEETNDTAAVAFETLYATAFRKAKVSDALRWAAGRRLQMGG